MKPNKVLGALLAAVAAGMGVQTYYLVQVHRRLEAAEPAPAERSETQVSPAAPAPHSLAALPGPRADSFAEGEAQVRGLFDKLHARVDGFGGPWPADPFFADGEAFPFGPSGSFAPRVDLEDRGDRYELRVDVPGADESAVVVRAEDGVLVVEGTRSTDREESAPGSFVRRERQFGRFERRMALPADADPSALETEQEDGVLRIAIAKRGQRANAAAGGS